MSLPIAACRLARPDLKLPKKSVNWISEEMDLEITEGLFSPNLSQDLEPLLKKLGAPSKMLVLEVNKVLALEAIGQILDK